MHGTGLKVNSSGMLEKPVNKKVTFSYSDDEDGNEEDGEGDNGDEEGNKGDGDKTEVREGGNDQVNEKEVASEVKQLAETKTAKEEEDEVNDQNGVEEPPRKKTCTEEASETTKVRENTEKSIDKLIDAELKELGDKSKVKLLSMSFFKCMFFISLLIMRVLLSIPLSTLCQRRFMKLDPGCNGIAFIQMKRRDGDPSPKDIVQHGLTSAAATKKHMSRFDLTQINPIIPRIL